MRNPARTPARVAAFDSVYVKPVESFFKQTVGMEVRLAAGLTCFYRTASGKEGIPAAEHQA